MSIVEFFNATNLIMCLIVIYMVLHLILSTPISSYTFKSGVRFAALIACGVIFIVGTVVLVQEVHFSKGGVVTNAVIKDHFSTVNSTLIKGPEVEYKVLYAFNDQDNVSYESEAVVDKYFWEMSKLNPDKKLKVVYLNGDPSTNRKHDFSEYNKAWLLLSLGIFGLLFSLLRQTKFIYKVTKSLSISEDSPTDLAPNLLAPYREPTVRMQKEEDEF